MLKLFTLLFLFFGLNSTTNAQFNISTTNKTAEKLEYKSTQELLDAIVTDEPGTRWIGSAGMYTAYSVIKKKEVYSNIKVGIPVLGGNLTPGASFMVNANYVTRVFLLNEGLETLVGKDGRFNADQKNPKTGQLERKRFVAFYCEAEADYGVELRKDASWGLSLGDSFGFNAGISKLDRREFRHTKLSRRIVVPRVVGGETVDIRTLEDICHKHFMQQKIKGLNKTVKQSLMDEMNNTIKNWAMTRRYTLCRTDDDCLDWYNNKIIWWAKGKNFPRCLDVPDAQHNVCVLRGLEGQNCPVIQYSTVVNKKLVPLKQPKRISDGQFEFTCDEGLKCKSIRKKGKYVVGQCKPIDPKTYEDPWKPKEEYIEIELMGNIKKIDFDGVEVVDPINCSHDA